jgi:polyisoprenoid-binding protein YceI
LFAWVLCIAAADAQARWTIDTKSSLAWWQMNPHMNHLWATTCPGEPSWRPGEERTAGWFMDRWLKAPSKLDSINVPMYPRPYARDVCLEAVRGAITALDTVGWKGIRGEVIVKAALLHTGQELRDTYARKSILEAESHPEIRLVIDSLTDVARRADTVTAAARGIFSLHGATRPVVATVRFWPEAGGLRVLGKFKIPVQALTEDYGLSAFALGLGVGMKVWRELFMGVDLLMRSQPLPDS